MRIGVSPAWVVSASSPEFTALDYLSAIHRTAGQGFSAIQLEVFRAEAVEEWTPAVRAQIREALETTGLVPSQFVAHFMHQDFRNPSALARRASLSAFERSLDIVADFPACPVVTVPLPPFERKVVGSPASVEHLRSMLVDYLGLLLERVHASGRRLALELMPYSLVGGTEGFLRLKSEAGLEALGYCFDTGHAWARKEPIVLIPGLLGEAIVGTHLCDNHANESLKLRPGAGSLPFSELLQALEASGYQGSLDLEILCSPEHVDREYAAGRAYLETLCCPCATSIL